MASPLYIDLDPDSRRALELDGVLEQAAAHASTAAGQAAVRSLRPIADAATLEEETATLDEAALAVAAGGRLLPARLPDPELALRDLAVDGLVVPPVALRDVATVLGAAADLRRRLAALPEDSPRLRALALRIADLRSIVEPVLAHTAPDGTILDSASPELRKIRQTIARTGERLRRHLESFVHDPAAAHVVRDSFVTQRNGRFVVPVRADSPRAVDGIVHASSSSGATLFVEPLDSIPLNNELVRLAEREAEEQDRVVRGWGDRLRERLDDVLSALSGVVRADTLQARALHAADIGGVRPRFSTDGTLRLVEARHPLLDRRLREHGSRCVPLTLGLAAGERVLVVSGPSTGGKTVALKTTGLAVIMAQCGMRVPAREVELPIVHQLRADIGDRQSIDADLSTFSAHISAVAQWLEGARPPALWLFDEIGTGTEPTEGAALAQAILEHLMAIGVWAVATTHQAALKTWAFTTQGAASAALEFDTERMRPTFRVLMGAAGASAGIDVASRLGLPGGIVARARGLIGETGRSAEAYMAKLRELTAELESRREAMIDAEAELSSRAATVEARLEREGERIRQDAARNLESVVKEFRQQAKAELAGIADRKERAKLERDQAKAEIRLRAALTEKERRVIRPSPPPATTGPFEPQLNLPARIVSLGRDGVVREIRGDRVVVGLGTTTFTVKKDDLAAPDAAPAGRTSERPRPGAVAAAAAAARRGSADEPLRETPPAELHLIGRRVDEALPELDKFLDETARAGRPEVRVVHGHGTGRLRVAVRRFLKDHPLVDNFRPGEQREGGDGATVVTMRS